MPKLVVVGVNELGVLADRDGECLKGRLEAKSWAYRAALCAPDFLYLVENGAASKADDDTLAARLSYFLWNSMPDDTLLALAAKGALLHELVNSQLIQTC